MKQKMKFGLLSLLSLALLLGSCTKDNGGDEPDPAAVQSVSLNKPATTILEGANEALLAVVAPATATNKAVTWTSGDAAIATVSDAGLVTAVKEGMAAITVTSVADNTKTATCVVTVSKMVVAVTGVSVDPTAATIAVGATKTLNATVLPANAANKAVTWTSSDVNIATVSEAGLVTAIKAGTAIIAVTTQDGNKAATCTVTAVVDVSRWAEGNLVSDGANGCKIGSPTDDGLCFHFGSLVGWTGGATGDGTGTGEPALAVQVKPTGYTGSTTWPAGYYTGGTAGTGYGLPATDAPSTGIGDPCRYYLGGTWRTPTAAEYVTLLGVSGDNTNQDVPLQVTGTALVFPASIVRDKSNGASDGVGLYGYYWSSSVYDATHGFLMNFSYSGVFPRDGFISSHGLPVRCVAPAR